MGMDRAIHVVTDGKDTATLEPLAVAKIFAKIAEEEKPNIILLGKQVSSRTKCTVWHDKHLETLLTWYKMHFELYSFSKNILVYYCKCCWLADLIGYATRYLFAIK